MFSKYVIFINYEDKRLFLKNDLDLSFTADINHAKEFVNHDKCLKLAKKLFYSGYYTDILKYSDMLDIMSKERSNNGLLSSDARRSSWN